MDKKTYFDRFSRIVRWRLPEKEAKDILCDYTELLSQRSGEADTTLIQDLGTPAQAAALLTEPKAYRRWLVVFTTMALCLLVPFILLQRNGFQKDPSTFMWIIYSLGAVTASVWFRPRSREPKTAFPKKLLSSLLLLLLIVVCSGVILGGLAMSIWEILPAGLYGTAAGWILRLTGCAAAAAGAYGLVKARTDDRRWRALYVLGLTALIECAFVLALLAGMDTSTYAPDWWVPYVTRWIILGGSGLFVTGASLC